MEIRKNLDSLKTFQKNILEFIESQENIEEKYENLIDFMEKSEFSNNISAQSLIILSIIKISNEHHRSHNFFNKIEQILHFLKDDIKQTYSNSQIFKIFHENKRLLLFLIEEEILKLDENIVNMIKTEAKFKKFNYFYYFFNEVKPMLKNKTLERKIEKQLNEIESKENSVSFEEMRRCGENEAFICQLIRDDNIEEFITFVGKNDLPLSTKIKPSIFETNPFLLDKDFSLIEYSAFFGSIQIFKYLFLNKEPLNSKLFLFAIHGNNPEIIHLLEENGIKPDNESIYKKCIIESIKCHHTEITEYLMSNYLTNEINNDFFYSKSFKYFNFFYFPRDLNNNSSFYYLCKYDYLLFVKLITKNKKVNVNALTISFFSL